jgi:universal bacterial protein YeaZ
MSKPRSAHNGPQADSGLTLVLNAAEGILQIAIADDENLPLFGAAITAPSRGVEVLTFSLESALTLLGKKPTDISRVAAVQGPGSFTGIRLTATTAAGLARSVAARQAGLNYMHCLAGQCEPFLRLAPVGAVLWVLVRARRDLVYIQAFVPGQETFHAFRALTELTVLTVSSGETAAHIQETMLRAGASHAFLAGSGAIENQDALASELALGNYSATTFLNIASPSPETLLRAAAEAEYADADIEPLYIRASDAEVNLPQIAARLGLDPVQAVRQLHTLTHTGPGHE